MLILKPPAFYVNENLYVGDAQKRLSYQKNIAQGLLI